MNEQGEQITMNRIRTLSLLAIAAVTVPAVMAYQNFTTPKAPDVPPQLPATPSKSQVELVAARPFKLDAPATHWWRAEQPKYDAGYVLVLKVDPVLVHPRQTAEPVLYVGAETAERVNLGHESGYVIAIVPTAKDGSGQPVLDLGAMPIFFGTAELPERIDAARAASELAAAQRNGVGPALGATTISITPAMEFESDHELKLYCSDLIAQYSPTETDLVNGLRVPLLGK
jgi:hypothetical protein